MLADPQHAPAEQIGFVHALVGLAGLVRQVRTLATAPARSGPSQPEPSQPDELVDLLLGIVAFGDAIASLAGDPSPGPEPSPPSGAYLR